MFKMHRFFLSVGLISSLMAIAILSACDSSGASPREQELQATVVALQTQAAMRQDNPTSTPVVPTTSPPTSEATQQAEIPTLIPVPTLAPTTTPAPAPPGGAAATPRTVATVTSIARVSASATIFPGGSSQENTESAHPYASKFDDTWLLSNPDGQAGATRVQFSRIELEQNVDWLVIMDGKDAEMQRITGSFPDGLQTELVPGNLVKLRLITDGSVQKWGFAVSRLESLPYTTLAYSPHSYPHKADLSWQFSNTDPQAQGTRLHFSRVDLEENVDWLVITDLKGESYQWITGHHKDGLWTLGVPGNGVGIKLISDGSVSDWGFNLDNLESAPPEVGQARPELKESLAESKHPYQSETKVWTLVNTNAQAAFSKVHFTRLDINGGSLTLLDGNDNRVQTFGDGRRTEFWSDDVPGRVVKIQLAGSPYSSDWGFRIDQLATGTAKDSLAESKHTYDSETKEWTLVNPNAKATFTKVHFTRLDMNGGSLTLLDGNDNQVQSFGDGRRSSFWSDVVPGRVVKIRLAGSPYSSDWGFRIDQLADGEP